MRNPTHEMPAPPVADSRPCPPGRSSVRELLVVALLVTLAQLPLVDRTLVTLDEGQVTAIGQRLAMGQALYRDVHTGVFPGLYWLVEVLFRLFGTHLYLTRGAMLAINTATATLLFHLARPLVPGRSAWLVPFGYWVLAVFSFPVFTMLTYSPLSLLAALGALLCCRRYVEEARVVDGVATGVLLGLATLAKQNFGALALVSVLVSALWTRREGRLAAVPLVRAFAVPVLAGLAVAAAAVARFALEGSLAAFVESTMVTIVGSQMDAFNQPLPPVLGPHPDGGVFYFLYGPGAMFNAMFLGEPTTGTASISAVIRVGYGAAYLALALAPLLAWRFARHDDARVRVTARVVLPFAVIFFPGIFPSAIWSHLAVVAPPLLVVLAAGASAALAWTAARSRRAASLMKAAGLVVVLAVAAWTARLAWVTRQGFPEKLTLAATGVSVTARDAALYRGATAFLETCAAPGEPVFVIPYMPMLYVTSRRPNPTPNDLLISIDVKEDVVLERLEASGVRCVVSNPRMYVQFSPFEQTFPRLAAYLAERFEPAGEVTAGDTTWKFLRRRGPAGGGA